MPTLMYARPLWRLRRLSARKAARKVHLLRTPYEGHRGRTSLCGQLGWPTSNEREYERIDKRKFIGTHHFRDTTCKRCLKLRSDQT